MWWSWTAVVRGRNKLSDSNSKIIKRLGMRYNFSSTESTDPPLHKSVFNDQLTKVLSGEEIINNNIDDIMIKWKQLNENKNKSAKTDDGTITITLSTLKFKINGEMKHVLVCVINATDDEFTYAFASDYNNDVVDPEVDPAPLFVSINGHEKYKVVGDFIVDSTRLRGLLDPNAESYPKKVTDWFDSAESTRRLQKLTQANVPGKLNTIEWLGGFLNQKSLVHYYASEYYASESDRVRENCTREIELLVTNTLLTTNSDLLALRVFFPEQFNKLTDNVNVTNLINFIKRKIAAEDVEDFLRNNLLQT